MGLTILTSIILGFVEGLTEFAPVSSTAHILLSGHILGIVQSNFFEVFSVAIQSGAILAAVFYFWKTIWSNLSLIPKVIVGFIPTAIAGVLLHGLVSKAFGSNALIGWALVAGGVALLFIKPINTDDNLKNLSYKQAFIIGCTQILAFIPGVSRSGATLIGGTLLSIPRSQIVVFSFLLGIPTILGASVVELHSMPKLSGSQWSLIILASLVAFVVALFTIKWFIKILTKKPLWWFGLYRIAIGIVVLILIK